MSVSIESFVKSAIRDIHNHPSGHALGQYQDTRHVYLGHSDWMVMRALDLLTRGHTAEHYSLCGLAGLNFISPLSPAHIVVSDINVNSLYFMLGIFTLILTCPSRAHWVAALFGKDQSATIQYLAQTDISDACFFALPQSSESEYADWQNQFRHWGLPPIFTQLLHAIRNGQWTESGWIPESPASTDRPIFLIKSDFNEIKNPHPVSHFFGMGWLKSETHYLKVRSHLAQSHVRFIPHNWMQESWQSRLLTQPAPKTAAIYVSNIGSTLPLSPEKSDYFNTHILPSIAASTLPHLAQNLTQRLMVQLLQLNQVVAEVIQHQNTDWICQFGRYSSSDIQVIIDTYS